LKKFFDGFDVSAVGQEKNQMIVGLHGGVVMRDDDILAPHHCAERSALRQRNVLDASADHLGAIRVAVHDHFQRFRGTPP